MTPDSMANEVEEQKLLLKQYLGQILLCQDEKEAVGSQTSYFQRKYARHKGDAILPSATQPDQQRRRRTGNAGHPRDGDRGQNRITESRDGKDHAECDEDHGFFTNGFHGTKHTGIQTH